MEDLQLAAEQVLPPTHSQITTIVVGEINNSEAPILLMTIRIAIQALEILILDLPGKAIQGAHGTNQTLATRLEAPVLILEEAAAVHLLAEAVEDHPAQVRDHQAADTN